MDSNVLRFAYNSLVNPGTLFEYNMLSKKVKYSKKEIVGGIINKNLFLKNLGYWRDGTKIPMSMVYKRIKKDGNNSTLLYAYGSYGYSIDPHLVQID